MLIFKGSFFSVEARKFDLEGSPGQFVVKE